MFTEVEFHALNIRGAFFRRSANLLWKRGELSFQPRANYRAAWYVANKNHGRKAGRGSRTAPRLLDEMALFRVPPSGRCKLPRRTALLRLQVHSSRLIAGAIAHRQLLCCLYQPSHRTIAIPSESGSLNCSISRFLIPAAAEARRTASSKSELGGCGEQELPFAVPSG